MARYIIKTLVNDSDEDFVDKFDGDEYVVPAHGELDVPDFIAYHFFGNPEIGGDGQRALERRGLGGQKAVGLKISIKAEGETPREEQFVVDGSKPVAKVKVAKKKTK